MHVNELLRNARKKEELRNFIADNGPKLKAVRGPVPQAAVARDANVNPTYISKIERGKTYGISFQSLMRILRVYTSMV